MSENAFGDLQLSKDKALEPVSYVQSDAIIDGHPQERAAIVVNDGNVIIGIWECAPYAEIFDNRPSYEMCTVVRGSCTLTDSAGNQETFAENSTFIIPRGFKGTFRANEPFRMYFMTASG